MHTCLVLGYHCASEDSVKLIQCEWFIFCYFTLYHLWFCVLFPVTYFRFFYVTWSYFLWWSYFH